MSNILQFKPTYYPSLADRVELYRELDREIKKMQKTLDDLKKDILKDIGDKDTIFNANGNPIATYTSQFTSRFDKDNFKLAYPGVYEKFEYKQESKVFRLK